MGLVLSATSNCDDDLHLVRSGSDATTDYPPCQCYATDKTGAGFSLLPVELVTQIFLEVVSGIRSHRMTRDPSMKHLIDYELFLAPLHLSFVCRQWRSIALSLPEIWARANLGRVHPEVLNLFLERADLADRTQHRYSVTPESKYASQNLDIVISNLDMFENLDVQLIQRLDKGWAIDNGEGAVTNEGANQEGSELGRLACLPSIDSITKARRLRSLSLTIRGETHEDVVHKARWCFQLLNCTQGLRNLHIDFPSFAVEQPKLGISAAALQNLQHLTLKTKDGLRISEVVRILRWTPSLVDLLVPVLSSKDDQFLEPSSGLLNLPELRTLDLPGTYSLYILRFIYSHILNAPKLDTLHIHSFHWDHTVAIDFLGELPCPIRTLVIDMCDTQYSWRIAEYLGHHSIGPTLQRLCIANSGSSMASERYRLKDDFFDFMATTPVDPSSGEQMPVLPNLEELCFFDSLETAGDSLSKMISARLLHNIPIHRATVGRQKEFVKETKQFKKLDVRAFTSSEDPHFEDMTELERIEREYPDLFGWFFGRRDYIELLYQGGLFSNVGRFGT